MEDISTGLKNISIFSNEITVKEYSQKTKLFPQELKVLNKYFVKKGAKVLDLGCGTGRTTYYLYRMGFSVVGVDISSAMVRVARKLYPYIDFIVGDACNLCFSDKTFDYVLFSFNGIDYIYPEVNRIIALKEIYRVLKNNGIFAFSTHNSWFLYPNSIRGYIFLIKFLIYNTFKGKIFSRYKYSKCNYGNLLTYHINPLSQIRQLKSIGFEVLDIVGRHGSMCKYFEPWIYYVARKKI